MSLIKKPYEISVWEDVIVYVSDFYGITITPTEFNENKTKYWYKNLNKYILCTNSSTYNSNIDYYTILESSNMDDFSALHKLIAYLYYTERELAIIGSSTMTSPARTINNVFKKNINGVETLTFDMYYQYEDIDEGLIVHNPLIDLVIDERKVKLYYDDKWYDFIVKKDDEKGRDYKYSFTCTSLAANELGKTGFNIELDTELENNTGTIWELGDAILEGSDWLTIKDNQEVILLTNDEALYLIKLNSNLTGTIRGTNTTITAGANEFIYAYYTPYINLEEGYFQFIYVNKHTDNPRALILEPDLYEDKITINCTVPPLPNPIPSPLPEGTYDLYASNIEWNEGYPKFCYQIKSTNLEDFSQNKTNYWYKSGNNYIRCTNESVYSSSTTYYIAAVDIADYRGRRYVRKLLMDYDPILELTVYKYKKPSDNNKTYYGYTTTEFLDAQSVTNYIYNSINFSGTSYWSSYNNTSLNAQVYPAVTSTNVNMDMANFSQYLVVRFGDINGRAINEGIVLNYSRINRFEKGEYYRFKVWVGTLSGTAVSSGSIPFKCIVKKYTLIDVDSANDKVYFTFNSAGTSGGNGYYYVDALCTESATWEDLDSNVGIFLYPRASGNLNTNYYIKDILLYRRISNNNGGYLDIGDVPEVRTIINYHFYNPDLNAGLTSAADYKFSDNDKSLYTPLYGSGDNEFEKVRSITAKESNRFNLLQELSETFECWVRFEIAHEANGLISTESYDYYKPVEIKASLYRENYYYIYNLASKEYLLSTTEFDSKKKYFESVVRKRLSKKVIFYGEILLDNFVGFKYGINLKDNNRTLDSELIVTKIIVKDNTCEAAENGFCSISRAEDNPIKENFAINLDYYVTLGLINGSNLNNDLYLNLNGSVGLYPKLSKYNKERNDLIETSALEANSINNLSAEYLAAQLTYNEAAKDLSKLLDSVSGTIILYTGYLYEDFGNQYTRVKIDCGEIELGLISAETHDNDNSSYRVRTKDYIAVTSNGLYLINTNLNYVMIEEFSSKSANGYITKTGWENSNNLLHTMLSNTKYVRILLAQSINLDLKVTPDDVEYLNIYDMNNIPAYGDEIYYIKSALTALPSTDTGTITYYIKATESTPQTGVSYYTLENNHFKPYTNTKFSSVDVYYKSTNEQYSAKTYFQTASNTTKLKFIGNSSSEVYIYAAARRVMELDTNDYINDGYTALKLAEVVTLTKLKDTAEVDMNRAKADLDSVLADYDSIKARLVDIAKATEEIEKDFNTKYSRYIQEGSWSDDNYIDDDVYYFDALAVLYLSAYPKVSYNFKVLELSLLEGYEAFKFDIGYKTYVEDTEFFGYRLVNGFDTPVKEEVVVTEATLNLDEPEKNDLKIQNYKSHFEDLFQRITAATHSLEFHSGEYGRAASAITSDGMVSEAVISKTLATASYIIQNSHDLSVVWDDTGILATNLSDPAQVTRLASGGLLVSSDGGQTWGVAISGYGVNANYINAGVIDADKINIMSGAYPTFRWDARGLRAYAYETSNGILRSYDPTKYVAHDRFGIYGLSGYLTPPILDTVTDVENNASFALTWNGLFIKSSHRDGYIRVSPTEDITLHSTLNNSDTVRGKFGLLGEDTNGNEIYGLALYGSDGLPTVETKSTGTLWLKSLMDIGVPGRDAQIYIGVGVEATQEEKLLTGDHGKKVFRVHGDADPITGAGGDSGIDRFAVYEDGFLVGHGAYHDGPINATSGTIGPLSISAIPLTLGIRIIQNDGDTFRLDEYGDPTPTSLSFNYSSSFETINSVVWTYGRTPDNMNVVPSNWIGQDGTVTLIYENIKNIFGGGLMYLKCTVNTSYFSQISIKLSKDGKAADAYSYDISSSLGYIINTSAITTNTTLLTASFYKNGEKVNWSGHTITWQYKSDPVIPTGATDWVTVNLNKSSLFSRVTSGIDYIVNLDILNINSIQIRFIIDKEVST